MSSAESDEVFDPSSSMGAPETIKSASRRQFPIRISDQGPRPFDVEAQERIMRWKHLVDFEWFPTWRIEPDVQLIRDVLQDHLNSCGFSSDAITVEFFAAGTHNKLYTINTTYLQTGLPAQCIFRVALPVYPWYKVESEVATTEFVRHFTDTPVPLIYAYDSSTNNKLGLEWILMEKIAGTPLEKAWPKLSSKVQVELAKSVAGWFHQLSSFEFNKIGSMYMRYTDMDLVFYIGPVVDQYFYDGRRLAYKLDRGPFPSLQTYYDAILDAQQQEFQDSRYLEEYHRLIRAAVYKNLIYAEERHVIAKVAKAAKSRDSGYKSNNGSDSGDDDGFCAGSRECGKDNGHGVSVIEPPAVQLGPDDVSDIFDGRVLLFCEEDLIGVTEALEALRTHLPNLAQEPGDGKFSTMLLHHDLSSSNILVDKDGLVQALVDWEMMSLDPPVRKDQYPQFLQSYNTDVAPTVQDLELYGEEDFLQNWKTYMLTILRRAFRERLEELQSPYLLVFEEPSKLHKDLDERIILRWKHRSEVADWVDRKLSAGDDDSACDSDYDSDEDVTDSMTGVLDGETEDTDSDARGDDSQAAEEMMAIGMKMPGIGTETMGIEAEEMTGIETEETARVKTEEMRGIATEKSTHERTCPQCGRSLARTWTEVVASWFIDVLVYSG